MTSESEKTFLTALGITIYLGGIGAIILMALMCEDA